MVAAASCSLLAQANLPIRTARTTLSEAAVAFQTRDEHQSARLWPTQYASGYVLINLRDWVGQTIAICGRVWKALPAK